MVEDIRSRLNYNYRITAQRFKEIFINADRFGASQLLYDSAERNWKTLEDLVAIIRELKKDKRYSIVDSYSETNTIVKLEVKAENLIRQLKEEGISFVELDPLFLRKTKEILDLYDEVVKEGG